MTSILKYLPFVFLVGCASFQNTDSDFEQLSNEIWQYRQAQSVYSPQNQSTELAQQLPNISADYLRQEYEITKTQLQKLKALDFDKLNEQDKINHAVLVHRLQNIVDSYRFKAHQIPLTAEGGFHTNLAFIVGRVDPTSKLSLKNYTARLNQFQSYFNQQMAWMSEGLREGNSQPQAVLLGYESSIEAFIVDDPTSSVYYKPFKQLEQYYSDFQVAEMQREAVAAIKNSVIPAYKAYLEYFTTQYYPNARKTIGVKYTPNGEDFYRNRSMHYTTTDLSVEDIHQKGLEQVARVKAEMLEIIKQVEFEGSFDDFLSFLRQDPQFYAKTPEELLMRAAYLAKKMDAQLPKLFRHLPRTPYGIAPVPDHLAPKYTTGRYAGASKSTDAGYYWVNTYALERRPLYELEALTLHEAVPGHHLQISLTREMENTPVYRSSYYMSAFGEGWGLYAEKLGLEAGFYQDPYSNFGRLTYEMWRACRLVVDTGLHMYDWTRQQAIDYMKSNTALSEHNITTEVDRYISWPAQALSYKIGEMTISELRQEAEQQLGEQFDIREFHYQVLKNGSVPLSVLKQQVRQYISESQ